jgi:hypothetical protein
MCRVDVGSSVVENSLLRFLCYMHAFVSLKLLIDSQIVLVVLLQDIDHQY